MLGDRDRVLLQHLRADRPGVHKRREIFQLGQFQVYLKRKAGVVGALANDAAGAVLKRIKRRMHGVRSGGFQKLYKGRHVFYRKIVVPVQVFEILPHGCLYAGVEGRAPAAVLFVDQAERVRERLHVFLGDLGRLICRPVVDDHNVQQVKDVRLRKRVQGFPQRLLHIIGRYTNR